MAIKNFLALAKTPARKTLLEIIEAGYEAIGIKETIRRNVERRGAEIRIAHEVVDVKQFEHIYLVGFGKAALRAAEALEEIIGDFITSGFVIDVSEPTTTLQKIKYFKGTHPLPTPANIEATKEIVALLENAGERDLVICLISGGGSALLCLPDDMTCLDENVVIEFLMQQGAPIQELNTVRKHISRIKGGNLARYAYPAEVIALIFSDVPGNDISVIASGPTVLDPSTKEDARKILEHYGFGDKIELVETPKKPRIFENVRNIVLLENTAALRGMDEKASELGLFPVICTDCMRGEARTAAQILFGNIAPGQAMLAAGETTVQVKGQGQGGRNHEFVLGALPFLKENDLIASLASDGWDNGPSAGAVADFETLKRAQALGLDPIKYLDNNDSFNFFKKLGDNVDTGRTGTNVSDFMIAIRFTNG